MEMKSLEMPELSAELAYVFADESENDQTFLGFSDGELSDCDFKDLKSMKQISPKKHNPKGFSLRIALRSNFLRDVSDKSEKTKEKKVLKKTNSPVKVKEEDPSEEFRFSCKSDSESDSESFLAKRAMNIKANKAMLAQLMADLEKMPGSVLRNTNTCRKELRTARNPRSSVPQRNSERISRRKTRSMGADFSATEESCELEMTLEDELMKVHNKPQRRDSVSQRPIKPHVVRRVEEITEEELQLVATNMTQKIYNRVNGSTCHQCRQKTIDTKTSCRNENCRGILGQFCGPCLRNRYGEDIKAALLDPEWRCPPCRGICNCSFCRQRDGRYPTGILFPMAQYHGFTDVHSYLCSLRDKLQTDETDDL